MLNQDDDETSLLQRPQRALTTTKTPLPWDQLWVVLFIQVSGSFASHTLPPFIPQLIRDIGVTHGNESLVGHYVGILQSSYFAAQALTVLCWSQMSDHIGRKPVFMISLFAISVSMFSFGCSTTFIGLVISRVMCGAFDASNDIVKIVLMDITDTTNLPRAYGYMPLPAMFGKIFGPIVGGTFSRPADRFPKIFGDSELLKTYPYLLPCAVPATFVAVAWLVTYFCFQESVSTRAPLWELIKDRFLQRSSSKLLTHEHLSSTLPASEEVILADAAPKPVPLKAMLTPKVMSVTASYAAMALFLVAFHTILPIFYAMPVKLGGLSLDPPRIGAILAASGFASGIFQLLFFARFVDRFGAGALYTTGILFGIPIVALFPVMNVLARAHGVSWALWLAIGVQHTLALGLVMCYPCLALYIKAAAPNRASLGTTNGIAQLVVAVGRIVGPASAASIFSYSVGEGHDAWLVYYFLMAIALLAVGASMLLPSDPSLWEVNT